ncbi:hypothetical protein BJY17_002810 [Agromyces hippuratus]|uniref:ATP-binding protein n=1 Tax=Agromyces hippuratus TaxID=286438 RepID=A0A852X1N1_9MICO|nr:ATP-binding protein [Agromyces hippuratus]NYG22063.1 hypothetical protein [Agromyces hippuratus]
MYTMTVELSVLESLGINLYSNAAAVLSELVANAYDADAGEVNITWQPRAVLETPSDGDSESDPEKPESALQEVLVSDDGCGMTVAELNERFLTAGYKKRDHEGTLSPIWNRPFMGRKGIGKLSVFSLAQTVEVFSTTANEESNGLRIVVSDLEQAIRDQKDYHPESVDVPAAYRKRGTTLVLSDLKKKRSSLTAMALRKRLARRFDVLDTRPAAEGGFRIVVNQKPITWADRQELKRLEFIWEFGTKTIPDEYLPPDCVRFVLPSSYVDDEKGWKVTGWIGTTKKPTDLVDDKDAGSLKNIIVLARKRPIQEGIIEKLDFSRLFGNYVTGQIEADFLDLDDPDYDDIATSDRQRLIEDDERVVALQEFLRRAFVIAADQWSDARPKKEAKDTLKSYPRLQEWLDERPDWQKDAAQKMIGTIASLDFEKHEAEDRAALLRSGVLAFERVGLRQSAEDLTKLGDLTAADLLPLLGQQDAYEAGLWVDILRSRVGAIEQLRGLTNADEKEVVLQKHLFNHLWLVDPSWERATGSETMEENLRKIEEGVFATDDEGKEIFGRIDIRYATLSGRHVIVELKRYSVRTDVTVLAEQGTKYVNALSSVLSKQNRENEIAKIEVIFVLGDHPGVKGKALKSAEEYRRLVLDPINGSYQLYDELIENARNQYQDYLDASAVAKKLDGLIESLHVLDADDDAAEDAVSADEEEDRAHS